MSEKKVRSSGKFDIIPNKEMLVNGNACSTPALKLEGIIIWLRYLLYRRWYTSTFSINAYGLTYPESIHPKTRNLTFNDVDDSLLCLAMANSSSKNIHFFFFRFLCVISTFDIRPLEHRLIYVNGITNKRNNHSNFKMVLLFSLFRNCGNGNVFAFNSILHIS